MDSIIVNNDEIAKIQWVEKNEIYYNKGYFDVSKRVLSGDTLVLIGNYDKDDDFYLSALISIFDSETEDSEDIILPFFCFEVILPFLQLDTTGRFTDLKPVQTGFQNPFYPHAEMNTLFQPPRFS